MSAAGVEAHKFIEDTLAGQKVVVFGKSQCPFTKKAREVFRTYPSLDGYRDVDIDHLPAMAAIQDAMEKLTGARSVPRVFIGGKFVGGGDDTVRMQASGELKTLLQKAGALKDEEGA